MCKNFMVIRHSFKELLAKSMVTLPMKCIVGMLNDKKISQTTKPQVNMLFNLIHQASNLHVGRKLLIIWNEILRKFVPIISSAESIELLLHACQLSCQHCRCYQISKPFASCKARYQSPLSRMTKSFWNMFTARQKCSGKPK